METLRLGHDAALIGDGFDESDFDVPSIEPHPQNEHHGGLLPLVRLAVHFLKNAAAIDVGFARLTAARWRLAGFRLTTRLWLHALREKALFSDDEAISGVTSLRPELLLTIPREVPLAIRDRLNGASSENVKSLIDLCLAGQAQLYAGPSKPDEPEGWREAGRDRALWRILSSVKTSGTTLPKNAERAFEEIKARRDWLKHPLSEEDYFSVWTGDVRTVTGRPEILQNVPDDQKIVLAKRLSVSADRRSRELERVLPLGL